jgi:CheY-like chemotaxis protein
VVSDSGVGVANEDKERIFDEYTQITDSTGRPGGTGLGLPISRRLAEMLGGSLTVESDLGRGSVFTAIVPWSFTEPACEETPGQAPLVTVDAQPDGEVLLVEDDAATLCVYETYLRDSGYRPVPAPTLERAGEYLAQGGAPVAVVLDILMGQGDSWGFLASLKGDPATRDIPVVVVSVLEERVKAALVGVEDYCVKPVDRDWLLAKLAALAGRSPVETVLIVDDEPIARYIMKGHLAGTGYRILEADGGAAGLELALTSRPDVILLDLLMPGMNGFDVLHGLAEHTETRDIPVIISTAHELDEHERRELEGSALAILSKRSSGRAAARDTVMEALRLALQMGTERHGHSHA